MDTRDRQIVHSFLARLELTVGWLELEALINAGIIPMENPRTGVWTSRLVKATRGSERPISVLAHNVLRLARKGQNVSVSVPHIQEAKGIVRQAMDVYHPAVFA
jgi:hypothetical protein